MFGVPDPVDSPSTRAQRAEISGIEAGLAQVREAPGEHRAHGVVLGLLDSTDDLAERGRRAEAARIEASLEKVEEREGEHRAPGVVLGLQDAADESGERSRLAEAARIEATLARVKAAGGKGGPRGVLFTTPEVTDDDEVGEEPPAVARIQARLAKVKADEESGWPYGDDPNVIFLINERVSPRPVRWRDTYRWAGIAASVLLHLLILSQLPQGSFVSQLVRLAQEAQQQRRRFPDDNTPFYELVDTPSREEKPSTPRAPLSDQDRRAHGGFGEPSTRPGSQGNTPELRLEPPGGGGRSTVADAGTGAGRDAGADKGAGKGAGASLADGSGRESTEVDKVAAGDVLVVPKGGSGSRGGLDLRSLSARGPGSIGGSVPNRKGGQVDLGPLTFDTEWYNWGPYAAEMLRRIRYHWMIPEIAQMGVGGVVRIHFFIERDGRVTGLTIERPSEHPPMDFAARDAILNASPLPPLPADLTGVDREGVTITFYYNTPVPDGEYTG